MPVRIGIIDYGMGNLKSVYKALRFLKTNPIFINKEEGFDCDGFVLPGVGAFEDGMRNLTPFIKVLKRGRNKTYFRYMFGYADAFL